MILTVCPNPCVDCTIELEKFNVGRLNRIENKIERWAGKALNTAVGVARLGYPVKTTGFMFETGGRRCCQYLESEGVEHSFVWNKGSVRVNYKIIDSRSMMTEINDKGETVTSAKQAELLKQITQLADSSGVCVISGSLPGGTEDSFYGQMVKAAGGRCKVVIDCERHKMLHAIDNGVYMVKPNLFELESVNSETYESIKDMIVGCRRLLDRGAQLVLLSLGKDGAILTNGTESYYCQSQNVAVNSTVGAGDSMLAAVAVALKLGAPLDEILRSGVAAGTASITTSGTNLFYKEKYDEIYQKVKAIKM